MDRRRPATIAAEHGHRIKCIILPFPIKGAKFLASCSCAWKGKRPRHTRREVASDGATHILKIVKELKK